MENLINDEYLLEEMLGMTPRPNSNHMRLLRSVTRQLEDYFQKRCEVATECSLYLTKEDLAKYDDEIELFKLIKEQTEYIPDIAIYCDKRSDKKTCFIGVPNLIVEIVSPSSVKMDLIKKKKLYEEYEVLEYWAIDPMDKEIKIFTDGKEFVYGFEGKVSSKKFENLRIDVSEVELI